MTDRLRLATGTAAVLASVRRSLAGDGVTAPLPAGGPERHQSVAMLRPEWPVEEPDAAAIIATSGSTGHPRGAVLSRSALVAAAEAAERRLDGPGTWVLALPPHYVAGLLVLVRSVVADRPLLQVGRGLAGLADLSLPGDGPYYGSLVPVQLSRALDDADLARSLARFDAVLVGGSAVDPRLLARAAEAGIAVVTTYGMTETCGGCVFAGRPLDGVDVATDANGRLTIGGPVLFSGYRLDPRATAESLVGGRLVTGDRGVVTDGRVTVSGRIDDVVLSGGSNVDLAAVERLVRGWASRVGAEAAVVGVPHSAWGTEVVAVIERPDAAGERGLGTSDPASLADLHHDLGGELPRYALPRRLVETASLPRTSGGKVDRRRLVLDLASAAEP